MPELFTWQPDWVSPRKEKTRDLREREQIGRSGAQTRLGRADTVRIYQEAGFTLERSELKALRDFWLARKAGFEAFEAPSLWKPGTSTLQAPHDFDSDTATGLMRFSADKFVVRWLSAGAAQVTLGFAQVLNSQQGDAYVYLYHIWAEDGSRPDEYLADWGSTVLHDGREWAPARIQHTEIEEDIEPQKEHCEIEIDLNDSALLRDHIQRKFDAHLWVEIIELDFATGTAWDYFTGRFGKRTRRGPIVKQQVGLWGDLMSRQLPTQLISRTCSFCLFDSQCSRKQPSVMTADNWTSSGLYVETWADGSGKMVLEDLDLDPKYYTYTAAHPNPNRATEGIVNWGYWYGGLAETGTGAYLQTRPIVFSAHGTGGTLHLIPLRPFRTGGSWLNPGDTIRFTPDCDGNLSTCRGKFHNDGAFNAEAFMPAYIEEAAASPQKLGK